MAYDQFGRIVPDGMPGSTPTPPAAQSGVPAPGTYYTGDPSNPITSNPNAGFGSRTLAAGTVDQYQLNPNAVNGAPLSAAYAPPGTPAPNPATAPPATNFGSSTGFGSSPTAGQFGAGAGPFDPWDPTKLGIAYDAAHNVGPYSGQQAVVGDRTSNLPLVYMLLNGRAAENPQGMADWADQYIGQGGGSGMSTSDFFNAAFTNDTQNPVFNMLHLNTDGTAQSTADQVKSFTQLMQAGLSQTVPPMILNSMLSMYGQAGREFIQATQSGQIDPNTTFTDFLQQRGLGPQMMTGGQ